MFTLGVLSNQTKITIQWEVIIPILCVVMFIILIRTIILIFMNQRLVSYIKMNEYEKALQTAEKLDKGLLTHSLNSDLNKLTLALLYLYKERKQDCQTYLTKIANRQLIMAKNYREAVIAFSNHDRELSDQAISRFENSPKPTNTKLFCYEKYKHNLLVIKEFCLDKNDETVKALKNLVEEEHSLQGDIILKLFIPN